MGESLGGCADGFVGRWVGGYVGWYVVHSVLRCFRDSVGGDPVFVFLSAMYTGPALA